MIRPESHQWSTNNQYKWQPKTKYNKIDIELVKDLIKLSKKLDLDKSHLTRLALFNLVKQLKSNQEVK